MEFGPLAEEVLEYPFIETPLLFWALPQNAGDQHSVSHNFWGRSDAVWTALPNQGSMCFAKERDRQGEQGGGGEE